VLGLSVQRQGCVGAYSEAERGAACPG